jgi:hypothetical protein
MGNQQTISNMQDKKLQKSSNTVSNFSEGEWFSVVKRGKIEMFEKYLKNGWDVNTLFKEVNNNKDL